MKYSFLWAFALFFLMVSCGPKETPTEQPASDMGKDTHSFAKPEEAVMKHLALDLVVDFEQKQLSGTATISFEKAEDAKELILDTHDLNISKVVAGDKELDFKLGEEQPFLGQPLIIQIAGLEGQEVTVHYTTSPTAEAVQWLTPAQTAGKEKPFLFTQSQAILARTWVPCQDSPGIRFTYSAKIQVPNNLLALMSATNPTKKNETGQYSFEMPQPIPAYLLALAVGDIEFKEIGPRTGVYAEPSLIDKSVNEFADLEDMLTAAESLYGPYKWEQYDLIVLPPSFPFGGMENPRLTFATPTILAGDRSLVSLVAHELAHSWSGNLVTNATWDDFWLNEGFTVYFENRIMEELYGASTADMLALISYQDLQSEVQSMMADGNAADTHLKLNLKGRNPDDGMTTIAYDKGFYLLKLIEETVGREKWDSFLKNYFNKNAFKTMTTEQFLEYIDANLLASMPEAKEKIKLEEWIYGDGLPANFPKIESDRFAKVEAQAKAFVDGTAPDQLETEGWVYQEWEHFLRSLPNEMSKEQMASLDKAFGFTQSGNSEILCQWLLHAIRNQYEAAYPQLEVFCINVGRRKFIQPLYVEMMKQEATQGMAKEIYAKSRANYHSVAYNTLDEIVK